MADQAEAIQLNHTRLSDYSDGIPTSERGSVDVPFALLSLLLLAIGVITVLSASFARAYYDPSHITGGNATYYFVRQALFALVGVGVMFFISRFPMDFYRRISSTVMTVSIALLALVLVPGIGEKVNGSRRWVNLQFTTFQPSEIVKIGVILYFAALLCRNKRQLNSLRGLIPFGLCMGIIFLLLALEPHMSAIIIIGAIGLVMLYLGGLPIRWFVVGGAAAALVLGVGYALFGYVRNRFTAWQDPFSDASNAGFQIVQSLYAIGSGGLLGLGLGNSRQKFLYLPEEHNDFIFSIYCEELGFVGAALLLALFAMLVIRGYWLSLHARDRYSSLVGAGISTHLAMQVLLNVAVCTNSIPCTGISMPLFSYGGTALLLQMAELGIVLSLSRDIPERRS